MGGFGALLVGIGIIVVIYGFIQRAKVGRISAPLFQTGQLAQGGAAAAGANGMGSAQGTVACPQPLMSPCSGKPCLWYSLKVTSERKDGDKTVTNTLRDDKIAAQFSIDDGSGPLFIDAKEGGDFEPNEVFRDSKKIGLLGGITNQALQFGNFQLETGILALGTEYKIEEHVLPVVPTLYVNGKMSQQGANVLSKPGFPRSMIITNKSRDEVLGSAQSGAKYALMGGAGSVVVGAILGIVASLMGGGEATADTAATTASAPAAMADAPAAAPAAAADAPADAPAAAAQPVGKRPGTNTGTNAGTKPATATPPAGGDAKAPPATPPAAETAKPAETAAAAAPPAGDTKPPPPKRPAFGAKK